MDRVGKGVFQDMDRVGIGVLQDAISTRVTGRRVFLDTATTDRLGRLRLLVVYSQHDTTHTL